MREHKEIEKVVSMCMEIAKSVYDRFGLDVKMKVDRFSFIAGYTAGVVHAREIIKEECHDD